MISRVASTGSAVVNYAVRQVEDKQVSKARSSIALVLFKSGLLLRRLTVALVLFTFGAAVLRAQQPEQWPQDDPYSDQQQPAYQQPQYDSQYGQAQPYPQQGYYQQQPAYPQAQGMNAQQLEQLVAPIALYPDALLAQVLAAATYPAQISAADQWRRGMGNAPPEQIAAGASAQTNWDPSVKALTAYPQVLAMMDQNLQWTTALGNA